MSRQPSAGADGGVVHFRFGAVACIVLAMTGTARGQTTATGDFNGDGFDDLAIGVPLEDVGAVTDAGAVNVLYGSADGLKAVGDQFWHQDVAGVNDDAEIDDEFGSSLAVGDFNGDGFDDLAIGAPGEDALGGVVHILLGSADGLTSVDDQIWHQNKPGILGDMEPDDSFGGSLATGDFNDDGFADLAVGVRDEDVGATEDAGAVSVLFGSGGGLSAAGDQVWHQDSAGILGGAETGESFGFALAAGDFNGDGNDDLAIGVVGEDTGGIAGAGAVNLIFGSPDGLDAEGNQVWHQDSPGIKDSVESGDSFGMSLAAGDFNGDGFIDLAIGVPHEDIDGSDIAGAVNLLYGGDSGLSGVGDQFWHQGLSGILDEAEDDDRFGISLVTGDFNGDFFFDDLAIGVDSEDVDGAIDAGAVAILFGDAGGMSPAGDQFWHQSSPGVLDVAQADDSLGEVVTAGDFDGDGFTYLAASAPTENFDGIDDAGAGNVLYGKDGGLSAAGDQFWHQNVDGVLDSAEDGDRFGGD